MSDLQEMVKAARDRYDALTPFEKAAHDYEQRRSFVRGMCPSDKNMEEWSKVVDLHLPPGIPTHIPLAWLIGKLKRIAGTGQSIEPDHWKFRCMARETAQEILDRIERG